MSRAKEPKIVAESQKIFKIIKNILIVAAVIIIGVIIITAMAAQKEKPAKKEALVAQEKWQLSWEKKPAYAGKTGVRHTSLPVAIESRDKEKIVISYTFSNNVGIMKGFSRDAGKSFDGIWKDATGWGCWHLRFTSDRTAFGWSDDEGKGYKQPNVLEKIS